LDLRSKKFFDILEEVKLKRRQQIGVVGRIKNKESRDKTCLESGFLTPGSENDN
jgi:hypothetical protein